MKFTTKAPVDLFLLDDKIFGKSIFLPFFGKEIPITIQTKFEFNKDHLSKAINVEFLGDDKGQKGHTNLIIELDLNEEEENKIQNADHTIEQHEIITPIINELIDNYRLKTQRWWIERISDRHILEIRSEYKFRKSRIGFSMFPNIQTINPKIKQEISNSIVRSYIGNQKMPIFLEYYLLALKNFHSARFDLSLVFINIALESLVFLLSNKALGETEHEKLIQAPNCAACGKPKHKNLREILIEVNKKIVGIDDKAVIALTEKVRRPNGSTLRNDIAHGKVLFLDVGNQHKKDADLAIKSFIEVTKLYSKNISDYL